MYEGYLFHKTAFSTHRPRNLEVNKNHTTKCDNKSLGCLGPHIFNSLPNKIKKETDYTKFKEFINNWFGMKCECNLCFFFYLSTGMSILYCEYDLGFDSFLVGNGFHFFFFFFYFFYFFFFLVNCIYTYF